MKQAPKGAALSERCLLLWLLLLIECSRIGELCHCRTGKATSTSCGWVQAARFALGHLSYAFLSQTHPYGLSG